MLSIEDIYYKHFFETGNFQCDSHSKCLSKGWPGNADYQASQH